MRFQHAHCFLNIVLHLRRGRSCECYNRRFPNFIDNGPDAAVFRPEIMSPLRNAMGLIYRIKGYLYLLQKENVLFLRERFGGHIKQFGLTGHHIFLHLHNGRLGQRRIQEMGHPVIFTEITHGIYLILHQSYQGRYNNGSTF